MIDLPCELNWQPANRTNTHTFNFKLPTFESPTVQFTVTSKTRIDAIHPSRSNPVEKLPRLVQTTALVGRSWAELKNSIPMSAGNKRTMFALAWPMSKFRHEQVGLRTHNALLYNSQCHSACQCMMPNASFSISIHGFMLPRYLGTVDPSPKTKQKMPKFQNKKR